MVATPKKILPITPAAPTSPDQPIAQLMPIVVRWEPLPDDYPIPDDPVDNIHQPLLAAALTDALRTANCLPTQALTPTNYPLCVTYNDAIVIKAPDWAYIPAISVERQAVDRSYTPNLQGELPTIVLEFISETEGGEYSIKPTTPIGKWFFYERILKVPIYGIFVPDRGLLELYRLTEDKYDLEIPDENGRHWIAELNLFLGPWRGDLGTERSGYWLRWWDAEGNLLLWGHEKAEQESQRADQASQRAEQESQRADAAQLKAERLAERLRQQGIDPDEVV
jgi:Putative restriction endonuclease